MANLETLPTPPADLRFRVAGTDQAEWFDTCGGMTLASFERALASQGKALADFGDIFDFGAGCGRLIRHLVGRVPPQTRISASDIDEPAITWLRQAFPRVDARVNEALPPLPFAKDCFDLIVCFSVFTHLDEEYQDAWLAELARVARPGGLLLITVMGEWNWNDALSKLAGLHQQEPEFLEKGFCYTKLDGWSEYFPDYYHTTFHRPAYIRSHWRKWFEVLDVQPDGADPHQDMVILRRPMNTSTRSTGPIHADRRAAAREAIASVKHWYHRMELAPGVFTPGNYHGAPVLDLLELPTDCCGLKVLDLGTRDGFFAFEMERRGAEVVAIDYWDRRSTGFDVAARLLDSKVEYIQQNVYDLDPDTLGKFDIVLCLGLIYHLPDPIRALHLIRSVCRGRLYLESHVIDHQFPLPDGTECSLGQVCPALAELPIMRFYPGTSLEGDPTNYWGPNLKCLEQMASECNFKVLKSKLYGGRGIVTCAIGDDARTAHLMALAQGHACPR